MANHEGQTYVFGELLRGFRQREGMTQQTLADRLGVHRRTVSDWERSEYLPRTREMVLDLAESLGLSPADVDRLLVASEYPPEHLPEAEVIIAPFPRLPLSAPMQAPPLPKHFVPRPDMSDTLKERLLAEDETAPGVLVVSAIHGLGGIGKSALAAALAHDPEVQARFPDGVLWVTLGQQPELHSLLSDWIVNGLRDCSYRPSTVAKASTHLRTLLLDKTTLLVVDDVWDSEHARPFLVGSSRCRVLITTRRADVADEVSAVLYQMDVMTPSQSLELLEARLGRLLAEGERQDAQHLARLVGHLPLALELAAVRVARGTSWTDLCAALEEEVARLEVLDNVRRRRKRATRLEAIFGLSLEALRAEDQEAWEAFAWLGVLPEDVTVAAPMASTLWNVDRPDAGNLLELLWNDSLLLIGSPVRIGNEEWPGYRLHDLLHDASRRLLTSDSICGLGHTLQEAHAFLLEHYQAFTQDGLWHTLPNDGYIHNHLCWHLVQLGDWEALHTLVATGDTHQCWAEARYATEGSYAGYMADLQLAWTHADEIAQTDLVVAGRQVRYALIESSLHSLAESIPPALLVAAVHYGVLSLEAGLAYAHHIPDPEQRSETLKGLAPYLSEPLLREALEIAREIGHGHARAEALIGLAPHLPQPLFREVLEAVQETEGERARAKALTGLAPHLPGSLLEQALVAAEEIENEWARAQIVTGLAPYLSPLLLSKALAGAREIDPGQARTRTPIHARAKALIGLAPYLPPPLLGEALEMAHEIEDEWERVQALIGLAPYLPEPLLEEGLAAAQKIENTNTRAQALTGLAPYLSESPLREALMTARQIDDANAQRKALSGLTPHLARSLQEQVLVESLMAAEEIENEWTRAQALTGLAPYLPEPLLAKAVGAAQADEIFRARILTGLAPYLSESLLVEALAVARETEYDRAEILMGLAPYLSESLLIEALAVARETRWNQERVEALVNLAPHLQGALQEQVLSEVLATVPEFASGNYMTVAKTLAGLAPYSSRGLLGEAVALARRFGSPSAWSALAPYLPEDLLDEAILEAGNYQNVVGKAHLLAELSPYLSRELLDKALSTALEIGSSRFRAEALAGLAPYLPRELVEKALTAELGDANEQIWALSGLAPHLSEKHLMDVLQAARSVELENYRTKVLNDLILHLPDRLGENTLEEMLKATQEIDDEQVSAEALSSLIPRLPDRLLGEALKAAHGLRETWLQIKVLTALAPHLSRTLQEEVLVEALAMACRLPNWQGEPYFDSPKGNALISLGPLLSERLLRQAFEAALELSVGCNSFGHCPCVDALIGLVPHMTAELQAEVFEIALELREEWSRARLLISLESHLPEPLRGQALEKALAAAREIREVGRRVRPLSDLTLHLPEPLQAQVRREALAAAREIEGARWRVSGLVYLARRQPEPLQEQVLGEALAAVQEITQEYDRVEALIVLAPHLPERLTIEALVVAQTIEDKKYRGKALTGLASKVPEKERKQILQNALMIAWETEDVKDRTTLLSGLAPHMAAWVIRDRASVNDTWVPMIHFLAARTRRNLFSDLRALAPIIEAFGGSESIAETFLAIQDVGRWWP